ncbi:hypothetical protein [Gordonia soli]|nr:hypothetical protein [Gordonia soli]
MSASHDRDRSAGAESVVDDPDIPHRYPHDAAFAFEDATPVGETARIVAETPAYEAARHGNDWNRGHALGGSDGTTEGQ